MVARYPPEAPSAFSIAHEIGGLEEVFPQFGANPLSDADILHCQYHAGNQLVAFPGADRLRRVPDAQAGMAEFIDEQVAEPAGEVHVELVA